MWNVEFGGLGVFFGRGRSCVGSGGGCVFVFVCEALVGKVVV